MHRPYTVTLNYQVYNVFNIDQTNIRKLKPELYTKIQDDNKGLPPELVPDIYSFPSMDKIINENDWQCPICLRNQDYSYFSPKHYEIVFQNKEQFDSNEAFYGTALYEMVNSVNLKGSSELSTNYTNMLTAE